MKRKKIVQECKRNWKNCKKCPFFGMGEYDTCVFSVPPGNWKLARKIQETQQDADEED